MIMEFTFCRHIFAHYSLTHYIAPPKVFQGEKPDRSLEMCECHLLPVVKHCGSPIWEKLRTVSLLNGTQTPVFWTVNLVLII